MVDKFEIDSGPNQYLPCLKGCIARGIAVEFSFIGCYGINEGDIASEMALAEQIGEAFEIFQENIHVIPVRHTEVVARRCPLPMRSIGRIIEPMQVKERTAIEVVLTGREHQAFRRSTPAQAMISFQPYARAFVQVSN